MENGRSETRGQPFWLNDWYVDPPSGRITRAGAEVKLEPKVMTVLELLASQPGEVFSRETLEAQAWEGLVVSYDALSTTIIKLRRALGDDSRHPLYIETVSKKGYRLVAPVSRGKPPSTSAAVSTNRWRALPVYIVVALLLAIFLSIFWFREAGVPDRSQSRNGVSLVVLPFINMNKDPTQEYFSDGITDDLINDLSSYANLNVIARRSAYVYKSRHTDIQTIARELAVTYVLDGSIRRDGKMIRINVQLIDAKTGSNIWVKRFDEKITGIFEVQDNIRKSILSALSVTLSKEELDRTRRQYTNSFEAYDLFLKGQSKIVTRASPNDSREAQTYMEQAISLDPGFARAHAALALIHADAYRFDWSDDTEKTRQLALKSGLRAIELDEQSPQAQWIMGYVYLFLFEDHEKAIRSASRSLELDPDNSDAITVLAVTHAFGDDPEKARLLMQELMQRNKSYSALVPSVLGLANLRLGKLSESLTAYNESLLINPSRVQSNTAKAVVLHRMGLVDEAEFQVIQLYSLHPNFDIDVWAARQPFKDRRFVERMKEDLYSSGVVRRKKS